MIHRLFAWWASQFEGKDIEEVVEEWHSFWIGVFEMVCLRIPPLAQVNEYALDELSEEYHYYAWGRAVGVMFWIVIVRCIFW